MPRIFVDGQERTALETHAPGTMGELLAELVEYLDGTHKMISEVSVDGIPLTEDALRSVAQREATTVGIVTLKTMTYVELAHLGLERAARLVQSVIEEVQQSAQSFRFQPPEEANRVYATCLEDLQLLVDMMDQMLRLREGIEAGGRQPETDALGSALRRLAAVTGELLLAHRRDDVIVLADLLSYELVPLLQDVRRVLHELLTRR
jgi:hypothetical protein